MPQQLTSVLQGLGNVTRTYITPSGPLAPPPAVPSSSALPAAQAAPTTGYQAGFNPRAALGLAEIVASTLEAQQRYQQAQQLHDPDYIASQIAKLAIPQEQRLMRAYAGPIKANMAEMGLAGAPGLISEAIAEATIPQAQQEATSEYLGGLSAAGYEYPPQFANIGNLIDQLYGTP